jgi:signal transduction histidine kinase
VLLVEDEPLVSKLVGQLLEEAGYEHVSIADHKEIAAAIARWKPRCIILDSEPGSDGHRRSWLDAAAIRRAHPDIPVLMFTADPAALAEARAGTTTRSKAAGYAGVIDKPFLVVEFLAALKHAVDTAQVAAPGQGNGLATEAITVFADAGAPAAAGWSVGDFFSMAVHELRTPLTSMDGETQMAQRYLTKDPDRLAESLRRIREQTKRMDRLIGDMLDHARVSVSGLSLEVVTFDLGVATAHTIGLLEPGDTHRVTFAPPASPVRVRGDPDRVAQIVGNLLANALKYSPLDTPIAVSLTAAGGEALLRVEDHGMGVPAGEHERIFAPFYRTLAARGVPGSGLGLPISRRLAVQHLGRLWLEKSDDTGSVFMLALPLAESTPTPAS